MTENQTRGSAFGGNVATALLLLALVFAAYSNSLHGAFAQDSDVLVLDDARLRSFTFEHIRAVLNGPYFSAEIDHTVYRPLVKLSWLVEYSLLGNADRPFGYHLVNLLWHALNVLLFWRLCLTVGRQRLLAFFAAAIFALHPANTEAVANIAGRADLMAAGFVLGGLLLYAGASSQRPGYLTWAGIFVCSAGALASKESGIVLLPLMVLFDAAFRADSLRWWRALFPSYATAAAAAACELLIRHAAIGGGRALVGQYLDNPLLGANFWQARLTACGVIWRYLKLMVWPASLSPDYSYNQIPLLSYPAGWLAAATLLLAFACLAMAYRRSRAFFFFGMWFFVALFPVSNVALLIGSIMAERFLYLPSAGFAACAAIAVFALADLAPSGPMLRRAAATAALTAMLGALGVRTFIRNFDWAGNFTLWSAATKASPNSFRPYFLTAIALARSSDPAVWAQAQWFDERAIAILADVPPERNRSLPLYLMGRLWMRRGEDLDRNGSPEAPGFYRLAVQAFERAKPIDLAFNQSLRTADLQRGVPDSAIPDVGNEPLWNDLASTLERLNQLPQAAEARRYALRLTPRDGALYLGMEKIESRLGHADVALRWAAEAMLLTQTPDAATHFAAAYRGVHAEGCEPLAGLPPAANLSCPAVKSVVCGAEQALLQSFQDDRAPQLAAAYSQTSLTGDDCKAGQ